MTVSGTGGGQLPKAGRKISFACINMIVQAARLVNKELENYTHTGHVMSLSTLRIITQLVLYVAKYVFPEI